MPIVPSGPGATPGRTHVGERWLLVGWPGLAPALPPGCEAARARGVHEALDVLRHERFECVLVEPDVLRDRPRAALRALRSVAPDSALHVVGPEPHPAVVRACARLGVEHAASAPQERPSRLRADRPTRPGHVDVGRFAAGCLERLGQGRALQEYIVDTFATAAQAGRVSLLVLDRRGARCVLRGARGPHADRVGTAFVGLDSDTVAARVARSGLPRADRGQTGGPHGYRGRAYAALPLPGRRSAMGVLCLTEFPGDVPTDERRLDNWVAAAGVAGSALEQRRLLARERRRSNRDPLTGIANRRAYAAALQRQCAHACRTGHGLALAMFDIDNFKQINTRYSHETGDQVIRHVAGLLATRRQTDMLSRQGGEEFGLLLTDLPSDGRETARTLVEALRQRLEQQPYALPDGRALPITVSAGVAFCAPASRPPGCRGPMNCAGLRQRAVLALQRAKDLGKNRVEGDSDAACP